MYAFVFYSEYSATHPITLAVQDVPQGILNSGIVRICNPLYSKSASSSKPFLPQKSLALLYKYAFLMNT